MKASATQLEIAGSYPDYIGIPLETFDNPTWWQLKGLSYTATGYGKKIPTSYMVKHNNRMKRVYAMVWSNSGTCYIIDKGKRLVVLHTFDSIVK